MPREILDLNLRHWHSMPIGHVQHFRMDGIWSIRNILQLVDSYLYYTTHQLAASIYVIHCYSGHKTVIL